MVQKLSHELRTPLTFFKGYVDLLLMEDIGPLNDDQRRFLDIVADRTMDIIGKIEDLIFLQQVDYLPAVRSPVSPDALARQAKDAVRGEAARSGVAITVDSPERSPRVLGDGDALLQVIEHLLDNAVKFSPHGGEIKFPLMMAPWFECLSRIRESVSRGISFSTSLSPSTRLMGRRAGILAAVELGYRSPGVLSLGTAGNWKRRVGTLLAVRSTLLSPSIGRTLWRADAIG